MSAKEQEKPSHSKQIDRKSLPETGLNSCQDTSEEGLVFDFIDDKALRWKIDLRIMPLLQAFLLCYTQHRSADTSKQMRYLYDSIH